MAHFYFHIRAGDQVYQDSDGVELAGLPEAWMHALDLAGLLLRKGTMEMPASDQWVEIGDERSPVIASLPFHRAATHH